MIYDLHTHTIYSDGDYTPKELVQKAKEKDLKYLAITDHNNIEGSKVACSLNDSDITIIPAVEMEGDYKYGTLHILGYNIDLNNENLNYTLNLMRNKRRIRVRTIFDELKKQDICIPAFEINKLISTKGDIGRPHIAKLLLKYDYVESVKEAFDYYLDDEKINLPKNDFVLRKEDVITLIKEADGIPVLAHYKTLNLEGSNLEDYIEELIEIGLMGIETGHSCFNQDNYKAAKYLAEKYNLLETAGSDFHGEKTKKDIELASWYHEKNEESVCSMLTFLEKKQKIKKI